VSGLTVKNPSVPFKALGKVLFAFLDSLAAKKFNCANLYLYPSVFL
jgi:hypothetical protein